MRKINTRLQGSFNGLLTRSGLVLVCFIALLHSFTAGAQTYCFPTYSSGCAISATFPQGHLISNVTLGTINNSPVGCGTTDFTALSTSITAGVATPILVTATGYCGVAVAADLNNDGDFADAGEILLTQQYVANNPALYSYNITVPAATAGGPHRLRVYNAGINAGGTAMMPCDAYQYGTWHDYTINVIASTCNGTPAAGTTAAAATLLNCNTTTTLSLTGSTAAAGITYQWQYNTSNTWVNFGTNAATQTTPNVTQSTQFRCVVTCTSAGGGSASSTPVTVSVIPQTVNIGNDTTICPGVNYTFNAGYAGATYAWNTGATTQSITVTNAGTYSVLVTLANGCTGSDAVVVTNGITPVNNLAATTNLCSGETANLNAGNSGSTFLWTPGSAATQTLNVTSGGIYQVAIKSTTGCVINSSTNVMIRPLPVASLPSDTSICPGAQIQLDAGNAGYAFAWNTGAVTQAIQVTDSGTYSVVITTPYNCTLTDAQHVAYLPAPYAEGFNFIPLFYEDLKKVQFSPLNPVNTNSYEWDFGDGSAVSTQVNPLHIFATGGDYTVTLTVFNGCGDYSVSLPVHVDLTTGIVTAGKDAMALLLYPNPSNDYITISNKSDDVKMQQVTVFNITGGVVYQHQSDNSKEHRFSVAGLAPGLYTVRVLSDKGYSIRKFEVLR